MLELMPGLTRIYEEWAEKYPDVQPLTIQFPARDGEDTEDGAKKGGLDGVLAYPLDGHWLLVTFGLTELGEKTSQEPRVSGAGFEFTCRIPRGPEEKAVPTWILRVLHAVADHFLAGTDLDVGHWILTPSPLGGEPANGDMTSLVIVPDVDIAHITTPNGIVLFFQLVGLMSGEGQEMQEAGTSSPLVAVLRDRDPRLVSDPGREPVQL
ncbi:suppressor of fused domain protein [Nocardiopsis xinjiangensis]|uniref:suppressor of fused domain protein n=1 Tax=Nocardiopsis xinjiangensis TaxID=124285 RepID=UPI000346BC1A|nr:suppressor of fused domain protein [Nocardiopsis xinjiangensis]